MTMWRREFLKELCNIPSIDKIPASYSMGIQFGARTAESCYGIHPTIAVTVTKIGECCELCGYDGENNQEECVTTYLSNKGIDATKYFHHRHRWTQKETIVLFEEFEFPNRVKALDVKLNDLLTTKQL